MSTELDSGDVGPGATKYRVTYTHDHDTLKNGDIVVVGVHDKDNLLVRVSDFTAHSIYGRALQYVHLEKIE